MHVGESEAIGRIVRIEEQLLWIDGAKVELEGALRSGILERGDAGGGRIGRAGIDGRQGTDREHGAEDKQGAEHGSRTPNGWVMSAKVAAGRRSDGLQRTPGGCTAHSADHGSCSESRGW